MNNQEMPTAKLVWFLQERAKELSCLYKIEELLKLETDISVICKGVIEALPQGWQYPELCQVKITLEEAEYCSPDFQATPWFHTVKLVVLDQEFGTISVFYRAEMPKEDMGPFLKEEIKLIGTVAERLGNFITYQKMKHVFAEYRTAAQDLLDSSKSEWRVVLDLLRQTDRNLFLRISHKMLYYLVWNGVDAAKGLLEYYSPNVKEDEEELLRDANRPFQKKELLSSSDFLSDETLKIATDHLPVGEILALIQKWIQQDKLSFLIKSLTSLNSPLSEIADAIRRYQRMAPEGIDIPDPTKKGVLVSLIRRLFSEQLDFINIAKNYIGIDDVFNLLHNVIFLPDSHGKLGGKSAGLFLAQQALKRSEEVKDLLPYIKIPKTWYLTSDLLLYFMHHNNFEEVVEQKYKEVNQVRVEYPNIVQTFKNAHFPPEISKALSAVLDDFGDCPVIVRSSSLLEDRTGAAFSGKYKSLFIANQGSKEQRLEALLDAIAEVYASMFGPDPIEYRAERGLLDFHEEMGIMIQQVVGTRVGPYYLPAYAGVAFSKNELRWSPRIKREDGLARLVPGLGTRAVDRVADDYPVLISPGQPGLRVNVTVEEMVRYSPKRIDVINLETNTFDTIDVVDLVRQYADEYPALNQVVSLAEGDHIRRLVGTGFDLQEGTPVVTFDGLLTNTPFVSRIHRLLRVLEEKLGNPVDIEFAHDGANFYLLQCRPQSSAIDAAAAPIPRDIPEDRIIFTAKRYVSNGKVKDITHIVYVDPQAYGELEDRQTMMAVGRAVGKLNALLPKRQFILMGPGRWGSRGDIKLGVSITYSDINNTAVLIEIARKSGNYVPDLSFGTHFFQDLVEGEIRYLPLYPDDPDIIFNERFLQQSPNLLPDILPEFAFLADTVRVIDLPGTTGGRILRVLLNADLDEAVGILAQPRSGQDIVDSRKAVGDQPGDGYWRWRLRMAEHIASQLDAERFGVKGIYVFGSTKNATAGPGSDIDLLVHVNGSAKQQEELNSWLEGWSLCLAEMNFTQTGYKSTGLLDIHLVTDEDIERKTSYAVKIGAVTDPARPLPLKKVGQ
jgi:hypothetical protein